MFASGTRRDDCLFRNTKKTTAAMSATPMIVAPTPIPAAAPDDNSEDFFCTDDPPVASDVLVAEVELVDKGYPEACTVELEDAVAPVAEFFAVDEGVEADAGDEESYTGRDYQLPPKDC